MTTLPIGEFGRKIQSIIGWLTLLSVLLSAIALGANRPVAWTFLALFIFLLFTAQILKDSLSGRRPILSHLWFPGLLFCGVMAWAFAQTLPGFLTPSHHPIWQFVPDIPGSISADPSKGYHHIMRLFCYAMVFWIAASSCQDRESARRYLVGIAVFSTALAIFGFYAFMVGHNVILGDKATAVVSSTFVNRNSYATYAVIGALANFVLFQKAMGQSFSHGIRDSLETFFGGSWLFGIGLLICLSAVVSSQSRAGAMAGLIGFIVAILAFKVQNSKRTWFLPLFLVGLFGFVATVVSSGLLHRVFTSTDEDARFLIYPRIIEAIGERPMLGHGLGAFQDVFSKSVPLEAAFAEWDMAHNVYLEFIFELGIPAALCLFLALGAVTVTIMRGIFKRKRGLEFPVFAIATIAATAFHSFFDFSLQMPAIAALFAWVVGMGFSQSFSSGNDKTANRVAHIS